MPIALKYRSPSGEERPWTLREIVQGQPLGHPSHAMFVHFPVAFYVGVLSLDILTRIHENSGLVYAATLLIIGAFMASVFAVTTGLVDYFQMIPGSRKRKVATQHLLLQVSTFTLFALALILRWPDRTDPRAHVVWILVEGLAVILLLMGQYLGGRLVYEMAMRVRTGRGVDL